MRHISAIYSVKIELPQYPRLLLLSSFQFPKKINNMKQVEGIKALKHC